MNKPAPPEASSETITRSYPEQVLDMDGKPVPAGEDVALPVAKVRQFERRWDLKAVNPTSTALDKK